MVAYGDYEIPDEIMAELVVLPLPMDETLAYAEQKAEHERFIGAWLIERGIKPPPHMDYIRYLVDRYQHPEWFTTEGVPKDAFTAEDMRALAELRARNGNLTDPDKYFDLKTGLLVQTLANDILAAGPIAEGVDNLTWSYRHGVWSPDKDVVRTRATWLLGEQYRRNYGSNAEDVIRGRAPRITCEPVSEFINMRNGLLDWRTGALKPFSPDVLSTVQLGVQWRPDAICPEFDRFLAQVVPADMIDLVWELIGYMMFSGNPLHKAVMLMGTGRNGKGTFLRVLNALLGVRNLTAVSLHDLNNTRFSTVSLFGKLANIAGDIDGTYLESTAMFKAITGQDVISAEHKGRDRFDFTAWAVPVFSANKIPGSSDVTTGYLSRWLIVPFPNDFTGREDRTLDDRLQVDSELEGIAVKAIPALCRLMARGDFELPLSGEEARSEFTRRVDQVRTWLDECCKIDNTYGWVARTHLYTDYKAWTVRDGNKPLKASEFYDRLRSAGIQEGRDPGVGTRGFVGVTVVDAAQPTYSWNP